MITINLHKEEGSNSILVLFLPMKLSYVIKGIVLPVFIDDLFH